MGIFDWLTTSRRREVSETRSASSGFTAEVLAAREAYISGARGIGELTATVQAAVALWENGLSMADVEGTTMLDRRTLAMAARSLALRGEAVFLIRDRLVPCSDWDMRTRGGIPTAYRVSVPEVGGGSSETALAAEVLHFTVGADLVAPWAGQAPLKRAQLTAGTLQAIEAALSDIYADAPLGSMVVPMPEGEDTDAMARGFRGRRGRVLLRESVTVTAAGGPAPAQDWRPSDLTPDLDKARMGEALEAARGSICWAFGILPAMLSPTATGPLIREGQRHLAQWQLAPVAEAMAEEASRKLGGTVRLDVMRPLQAFDAGGRARAAAGIIQALAQAQEAGVDPDVALNLVNWGNET